MRDVFDYMAGDPEDRLDDARWDDEPEDEDEIYGEAGGGGHPLANGAPCRCSVCRGTAPPGPPLCRSKSPRGVACQRLEGHEGSCSAFCGRGTEVFVEWDYERAPAK